MSGTQKFPEARVTSQLLRSLWHPFGAFDASLSCPCRRLLAVPCTIVAGRAAQSIGLIAVEGESLTVRNDTTREIDRVLLLYVVHEFVEYRIVRSVLTMSQFVTHGPRHFFVGKQDIVVVGRTQPQMNSV